MFHCIAWSLQATAVTVAFPSHCLEYVSFTGEKLSVNKKRSNQSFKCKYLEDRPCFPRFIVKNSYKACWNFDMNFDYSCVCLRFSDSTDGLSAELLVYVIALHRCSEIIILLAIHTINLKILKRQPDKYACCNADQRIVTWVLITFGMANHVKLPPKFQAPVFIVWWVVAATVTYIGTFLSLHRQWSRFILTLFFKFVQLSWITHK